MASQQSQKTFDALIDQLTKFKGVKRDAKAHFEAAAIIRALFVCLDGPDRTAILLAAIPVVTVSARVAVDLNLFEIITNHGGPITSQELAAKTPADELLITRLLRALATFGFVHEVGEQTWTSTPVSKSMAAPEMAAGHRMIGDFMIESARAMPKYLRETGYKVPTQPNDGLAQYAFKSKLSTFGILDSMPQLRRDFNVHMSHNIGEYNFWADWFSVKDQLLQGFDSSSALVVDIGGGKGHDLAAFHRRYPGTGRLVLQDLAPALESVVDLDPSIEQMAYNFFHEQPVIGARAYVLNRILHNWSDEMCLQILQPIRKAMKAGYSKLLIHAIVVPKKDAPPSHALQDILMMVLGGMERTEKQFRGLLEKAGLEITSITPPTDGRSDSMVVAMIKS